VASTLADYLWGDKKDGFTGFYGQLSGGASYSLTADRSGHTKVPTMADVGAAQKPEDKLKLLQQMADVVSIQADAATATGRTENVGGMLASAKDVLLAISSVVDGLKTKDGSVAAGKADPALKDYQSQIGGALTSLRTAMDKLANLGASGTDLTAMDDLAGGLATSAGTTWRRTGSTFRADSSKLVDILV
jgi:hypothetical protein